MEHLGFEFRLRSKNPHVPQALLPKPHSSPYGNLNGSLKLDTATRKTETSKHHALTLKPFRQAGLSCERNSALCCASEPRTLQSAVRGRVLEVHRPV